MNPYVRWTLRNKLTWRLLQWRIDRWAKRRVRGGPFKGLHFLGTSINSALFPKYLGTYELELHSIFDELKHQPVPRMMNLGAGEGYYAVGALYAGIASEVIAYESDKRSSFLINELCDLNGINPDRITVRGTCTLQELRTVAEEWHPNLILVDIEGAEVILLDPARVQHLIHAHLIVEVHDFAVDGICNCLMERFAGTHAVQVIEGRERELSMLDRCNDSFLSLLPQYCRAYALTEFRPDGMKWLWLKALEPLQS